MAERAAGEAAECEAMMHKARKGDFLTRAGPSTVRTPRLDEKELRGGAERNKAQRGDQGGPAGDAEKNPETRWSRYPPVTFVPTWWRRISR
jgi:hypothetical protein